MTTTTSTTAPEPAVLTGPVAAVWGQGVSLNHEKTSVLIEAPLNDILQPALSATEQSGELSSRRSTTSGSVSRNGIRLPFSFLVLMAFMTTRWSSS